MMADLRCANCAAWHRKSEVAGECRRRAPCIKDLGSQALGIWPATRSDAWCFEHEQPFVDEGSPT